jgi:hypothetical protein
MKKYISIIILLLTASTAFAVLMSSFTSWDDLIERSPEIIIARCTSTLGSSKSERPILNIDGMIPSDIEVIAILKGNGKPGLEHLTSQYWPCPGRAFLLFANYENDQYYKGYVAVEKYRVVPMNRYASENNQFLTNELSGKTLREQVQMILNNRLLDLNEELADNSNEMKHLEMGWPTNSPPAIQKSTAP